MCPAELPTQPSSGCCEGCGCCVTAALCSAAWRAGGAATAVRLNPPGAAPGCAPGRLTGEAWFRNILLCVCSFSCAASPDGPGLACCTTRMLDVCLPGLVWGHVCLRMCARLRNTVVMCVVRLVLSQPHLACVQASLTSLYVTLRSASLPCGCACVCTSLLLYHQWLLQLHPRPHVSFFSQGALHHQHMSCVVTRPISASFVRLFCCRDP